MSVPNRAQDPKRQASYVVKEPKTAFGKRRLMTKQLKQGTEALKRSSTYGGNPVSKTDMGVPKSGASGAFKKMGFKTPIERAKARESRPGKPPLPGF